MALKGRRGGGASRVAGLLIVLRGQLILCSYRKPAIGVRTSWALMGWDGMRWGCLALEPGRVTQHWRSTEIHMHAHSTATEAARDWGKYTGAQYSWELSGRGGRSAGVRWVLSACTLDICILFLQRNRDSYVRSAIECARNSREFGASVPSRRCFFARTWASIEVSTSFATTASSRRRSSTRCGS